MTAETYQPLERRFLIPENVSLRIQRLAIIEQLIAEMDLTEMQIVRLMLEHEDAAQTPRGDT